MSAKHAQQAVDVRAASRFGLEQLDEARHVRALDLGAAGRPSSTAVATVCCTPPASVAQRQRVAQAAHADLAESPVAR
jgi:hypothetical protein